MATHVVILCGGAGTRLWPASRPERPKAFLALLGDASPFEATVQRVAPLITDGVLIVVGGVSHRSLIEEQLAQTGRNAILLLEPESRDSGPAVAAASAWLSSHDPDGVALFAASDHYIPDPCAFRTAVEIANIEAARGRIVALGVKPTAPLTSYGYIEPSGSGLCAVSAFIEKPDRRSARHYVDSGYLWNSGNFVAPPRVVLAELERHVPAMAKSARVAVGRSDAPCVLLSAEFCDAPRLSIDYAMMEKSDLVSVLPVDFAWSDLGAWDAVHALATPNSGRVFDDTGGNLLRAAPGVALAAIGVTGLAVVAEPDGVLVCRMEEAQSVKRVGEWLRMSAAETPVSVETDFGQAAAQFCDWVRLSALPLWATCGLDRDGAAVEALDDSGRQRADFRRARVQTRQAFVYASAAQDGWSGGGDEISKRIFTRFMDTNLKGDGLYRTRVARGGEVLDDRTSLYDQAFALLALAAMHKRDESDGFARSTALNLLHALDALRLQEGGWREEVGEPYQANSHMHLFEGLLAWAELDSEGPWIQTAREVALLAHDVFIDERGVLREFFSEGWARAPHPIGTLIEPGHQFEWAWLLTRWARLSGDDWAQQAAIKLYGHGRSGFNAERGVIMDELNEDLSLRSGSARLWPQGEWLKAALILAEDVVGAPRRMYMADAGQALIALVQYLRPTGLWSDKMQASGEFVAEPAPATSLYHIVTAYLQIRSSAALLDECYAI